MTGGGPSQVEKDLAAARVLLDIWKVFHHTKMNIAPYEKLVSIAMCIYTLPSPVARSIGADVNQRMQGKPQ